MYIYVFRLWVVISLIYKVPSQPSLQVFVVSLISGQIYHAASFFTPSSYIDCCLTALQPDCGLFFFFLFVFTFIRRLSTWTFFSDSTFFSH